MISETKKRLTHLVEINRALSNDLDISRRLITNLSRERDALRGRVDTLEDEIESMSFADVSRESQCEVDQVQEQLLREQYKMDETIKERDLALRDAEKAKARSNQAEQRFNALVSQFDQLEQERDLAMAQLEESSAAIDEIRYRLINLPEESLLGGFHA